MLFCQDIGALWKTLLIVCYVIWKHKSLRICFGLIFIVLKSDTCLTRIIVTPAEEIKLSSNLILYDDKTENLVEKRNMPSVVLASKIPTKSSSANNIYNLGMINYILWLWNL